VGTRAQAPHGSVVARVAIIQPEPVVGRAQTERGTVVARVPTSREPITLRPPARPRPSHAGNEPFAETRPTLIPPGALEVREIKLLIAARCARLDRGADHFRLLDLPIGAPVDAVRNAYLELARYLQPEKLAQLGITEQASDAHRLLAQAGIAVTTLTDPKRRAEYLESLWTPAPLAPPPAQAAVVDRRTLAAECYQRGMQALRADQPAQAVVELTLAFELSSYDVDYGAMLWWAKFCVAPDKASVAIETRKALERAIHQSRRPAIARFYLARVARELGREQSALHHFRDVLALAPDHAEAASELRALEARLAGA
jgi:tetratricopeptide (TPR) repeat protein